MLAPVLGGSSVRHFGAPPLPSPALGEASAAPRIAMASSTSAVLTVRGGARRRTSGAGAFSTRPSCSAARVTCSRVEPRFEHGASSRPLPRTEATPSRVLAAVAPGRRRSAQRARGASIACSSAKVAIPAAQASGWPPKVRSVITRDKGGGDIAARPAGADRHPVAECLRDGDDVRANRLVLEREPAARAAEPRLDLVEHEEDPPLVAHTPHRLR